MAADWAKIETEYITTDTSYRKLAEKYSIDQATIARKAKKDDWISKRQRHISTTQAKVLAADTNKQANRASALNSAADLLLRKMVRAMEVYDALPATAAKNYSDALKNIKEIHMIRSNEDIEEQRARINKLIRDTEKDERNTNITVTLQGELDSYGG